MFIEYWWWWLTTVIVYCCCCCLYYYCSCSRSRRFYQQYPLLIPHQLHALSPKRIPSFFIKRFFFSFLNFKVQCINMFFSFYFQSFPFSFLWTALKTILYKYCVVCLIMDELSWTNVKPFNSVGFPFFSCVTDIIIIFFFYNRPTYASFVMVCWCWCWCWCFVC